MIWSTRHGAAIAMRSTCSCSMSSTGSTPSPGWWRRTPTSRKAPSRKRSSGAGAISRGSASATKFEPWLRRLLLNSIAEEFRSGDASRPRSGSAARAERCRRLDDVADRDELQRAFRALSIDHRTIVVLHHYLGLSLDEAAASIGIPPGTARSRLHYAMDALRATLEIGRPRAYDREGCTRERAPRPRGPPVAIRSSSGAAARPERLRNTARERVAAHARTVASAARRTAVHRAADAGRGRRGNGPGRRRLGADLISFNGSGPSIIGSGASPRRHRAAPSPTSPIPCPSGHGNCLGLLQPGPHATTSFVPAFESYAVAGGGPHAGRPRRVRPHERHRRPIHPLPRRDHVRRRDLCLPPAGRRNRPRPRRPKPASGPRPTTLRGGSWTRRPQCVCPDARDDRWGEWLPHDAECSGGAAHGSRSLHHGPRRAAVRRACSSAATPP